MNPCTQMSSIEKIKEDIQRGALRFQTLDLKLDSMDKKQDQILEQVKYTNGRVTKLEKFQQCVLWIAVGAVFAVAAEQIGLLKILIGILN